MTRRDENCSGCSTSPTRRCISNGEGLRRAVERFLWHCAELRGYLANNETALIDYGSRYRAGSPISTSRAAKRQRMRWSPRGAHRVALGEPRCSMGDWGRATVPTHGLSPSFFPLPRAMELVHTITAVTPASN